MKLSQFNQFFVSVLIGVLLSACGETQTPSNQETAVETQPEPETANLAQSAASSFVVDFNNGSYEPLARTFGPRDDPSVADPAYTVEVKDNAAHYIAPATAPGPRLTGFLDLPADKVPIEGNLIHEWTFPDVTDLKALGKNQSSGVVVAGCYIRGDLQDWQGGMFGDYWFGYFWTPQSGPLSVIRQGQNNLVVEPFTAEEKVSYRIEKKGLTMGLWAKYDDEEWHQVGDGVTITLNEGGSQAVAITHIRVLDTSGGPVDVRVDDLIWKIEQ